MVSPDPRRSKPSRYYGRPDNPTCVECEQITHPIGKTTEDGPVCTHCINKRSQETGTLFQRKGF